jgi:adenylate cyclase
VADIHLKRKLKAVLLADVVGYSRLMGVDEEGTHVKLADYVSDLIEPKVAEHSGRLIRSMGDGFLVEFDSAADAVSCALEIQRELAGREAEADADRRIQLRIGINTGDVIVDERDIYGNSVNIAARLEGLAEPGDVYITRGVRDQLEGHPGLSFEDKGERRVKNIKNPIRVYCVKIFKEQQRRAPLWRLMNHGRRLAQNSFALRPRAALLTGFMLAITATLTIAALPTWRDLSRSPPRASILILPFVNLSDDRQQDYFADAVTDDLTTDLSRLPGTFVISRATAFTYKGKAVDARQVGKECGVRYVLEGSIRRVGTRMQTNAQLVDTVSGADIWADRFDNEVIDLFELQQAVTGRIASSLDIQLVKAESRRALDERAENPDAVDLRLHGMAAYMNSLTPANTRAGRRFLEQAVGLDPNYALAWAWLADVLVSDYLNRWNDAGTEQLDQAETAVRRAVAIDPDLALAHYADGFIHRAKGEHQAALVSFNRAIEINPNYARAYAQKGNELINIGRPTDAPPLAEKAIKLSPRDPSIGIFYWIIGKAYFFAGSYRDAIPWLQRSVGVRPNLWYNNLYLVGAHSLIGDTATARKTLAEFHSRFRDPRFTLAVVEAHEQADPNDDPFYREGRRKLHEGLLEAGLAPQ